MEKRDGDLGVALSEQRTEQKDAMPALRPRDWAYYEARRICDEQGITDMEACARIAAGLRHRAFTEAAQPFIKMKADVAAFAMPTWRVETDGTITMVNDGISDDQRATLKILDKMIEQLRPPPD